MRFSCRGGGSYANQKSDNHRFEMEPHVARIIERRESPVLSVYFDGNNGLLFHCLGTLHPLLRTIILPGERLILLIDM